MVDRRATRAAVRSEADLARVGNVAGIERATVVKLLVDVERCLGLLNDDCSEVALARHEQECISMSRVLRESPKNLGTELEIRSMSCSVPRQPIAARAPAATLSAEDPYELVWVVMNRKRVAGMHRQRLRKEQFN